MLSKKISAISKRVSSGLTPLRSNPEFWLDGTIPWLKTEQLGEKYIFTTTEKISEAALRETSVKIYPPNTLSVAMYGEGKTRGNVSIIKSAMATNQACCNIEIDPELADFEYVYYFLKTQYNELRNLSSGVRKNLNSEDIKNFVIRLPNDLADQRKIASILSSLDAKIDCNNRINEKLDSLAKFIYDYWFVQFDFPDANGKPYKSSGGMMVYNDILKREVPKDWKIEKISKFASIGSGYPFDSASFSDEGAYKVITIKNVQDGYLDVDKTDFVNSIPSAMKGFCLLEIGDILISLTGNVGRICLVDHSNLLLNQRVGKLICEQDLKMYFYNYFKSPDTRLWLENISTGTSQKNLSPIEAVDKYFLMPPNDVLERFNALIINNFNAIINNSIQNRQLISLRDWLLPLLMNGQVTTS